MSDHAALKTKTVKVPGQYPPGSRTTKNTHSSPALSETRSIRLSTLDRNSLRSGELFSLW